MPTRGAWRGGMTGQGDLDELRGALLAGLEGLAEALLGPPSMRKPRTWRWGSKGSLCLELQGRKRSHGLPSLVLPPPRPWPTSRSW